jgi:glycosyltransferase involved in cell wall biosynthesis
MNNKISFFDSYSDSSGGAPKSMLSLAKLLQSESYVANIYTSKNGTLTNSAKEIGINSFSLNVPDILLLRRKDLRRSTIFYLSYFFALIAIWVNCIRYIKNLKGQKVCFNDIRCFLFYLPIAIIKRKDLIWYVRINDRVKFITYIGTILSNKIILISSSCIEMFKKSEVMNIKNKTSIVHTGFPCPNKYEFFPQEKISLGFVGVLSKRKNIELLISSFNLLDDTIKSKLSVIIVGSAKDDDKDYELEIKKLISDNHLSNIFVFTGNTSNVDQYYKKLDAVVLTSFSEGLPRVIIEGLSHGCFALATPVDGVIDIITKDSFGAIVEDYSPQALALAISNLTDNINKLTASRLSRVDYIKENFSEESFLNDFIDSVWQ